MYLDSRKVIIGIACLIFGLIAWWFTDIKNEATRQAIEAIETGASSTKSALGKFEEFKNALAQSENLLKQNEYRAAATALYHAYPSFEMLVNGRGEMEIAPGQTLRAWFEQEKQAYHHLMDSAYAEMVAGVKDGSLSNVQVEEALRHLPFPFGGEFKRRYQADREAIADARASAASQWVIIRVLNGFGSNGIAEKAIEPVLRNKWSVDNPYQLVFGQTMSRDEERNAIRVFHIYLNAEFLNYQADDPNVASRGANTVPRLLTCVWTLKNAEPSLPVFSWDKLEPIEVVNEPPETQTFRFENHRQYADFTELADQQRDTLMQLLIEELIAELPPGTVPAS